MALKFIGERTVGTLNGMKSGFVKDDLYRVYDAGILVPGGVSVDHGDFVSWDGTKWVKEADIKILTTSDLSPDSIPESTSESNPLMTAEDTERMINAMKPIDAMTLRFEFSKKDYNPEAAGVGSAGTWTKVDSPTLNIWDWKNTNTDWTSAFQGAFPDTDNEVRVIAAGDTSSVTTMEKLFAGVYTNKPQQTSYSLSARNNIVSCCSMNVEGCVLNNMFTGTALSKVFDCSKASECRELFADTFIEEFPDMELPNCTIVNAMFARCYKLKRIGTLIFDDTKLTGIGAIIWSQAGYSILEEIEGFIGTGGVTDFTNLFSGCGKLKIIGGSIDCSSATDITAMFNGCNALERLPELVALGSSNVTITYGAFASCYKLKEVPLFDTSHITDARSMFLNCYGLTELPDYDFSSVTKVGSFCRSCENVSSGIIETYNKFLDRGASITDHSRTFENCGINTPEGRAALAQIPASWGGLAEE